MGEIDDAALQTILKNNAEKSTEYLSEVMATMRKANEAETHKPKQQYQFSGYFTPLQLKILAELLQKFEDD